MKNTPTIAPKGEHPPLPWSLCQGSSSKSPTLPPHTVSGCADDDPPEWLRVSQAVRRFGIGRSTLYRLMAMARFKSVSLKQPGALRGRRLINADSLRRYLEGLA